MPNTTEVSSGGFSLRHILQRHEEQLMDPEKNICLLCKRIFKNGDQIKRHRSLSKLHSSRLKRLKQRLFSEEQLDRLERKEREALYRDRAKERRLKFGQTDRVVTSEAHHRDHVETKPVSEPISKDNKGAAILTKLGWQEGKGLGRNNQGMTDLIKYDSQVGTSGLGAKSYKVDSNLSYKEAAKRVMYMRYHEISSDDET